MPEIPTELMERVHEGAQAILQSAKTSQLILMLANEEVAADTFDAVMSVVPGGGSGGGR